MTRMNEKAEKHDSIGRQAAIDAMNTWDKFGCDPDGRLVRFDDNKHYVPYVRYDDMVYVIKSLPSAQPEKKKGKWIEFDSSEDKYDVIKCPCCKHTFTVDSYHWTDIGFIKDDFKFCPNCGADMRGKKNEDK